MDWLGAKKICQNHGAKLLTISDEQEEKTVMQLLLQKFVGAPFSIAVIYIGLLSNEKVQQSKILVAENLSIFVLAQKIRRFAVMETQKHIWFGFSSRQMAATLRCGWMILHQSSSSGTNGTTSHMQR